MKKKRPETEPVLVSLEVFVSISGHKPDQTAGFVYYAKQEKLGPMSVLKWRKMYKNFMNKPTR